MANIIIPKRSTVAGKVPVTGDLVTGEIAINLTDKKLYSKDGSGAIVEIGGGSVGLLNVTTGIASPDYIQFDTSATNTAAVGKLYWDAGEGSFLYTLSGGNVTQNLHPGSELVYNGTGATLTKGQVVYLSGAQGQRPSVALAIATSDATSARTIGIVAESIANGAEGWIRTSGILEGFDTSSFAAGSQLYLSGTTAGAMTATKPVAPIHLVYTARVIKSHATAGRVLVGIQNGYELDEIHDVLITSPVDNEVLTYNTATGLWKNETIVSALGYTPYNASNPAGYITSSGSISGNAATASLATAATRTVIQDTRTAALLPNDYVDYRTTFEFTNQIVSGGDWHSVMTMQGWHDGYAAWQIIGPSSSSSAHENFYLRSGVGTTWNSLRRIWHSGDSTISASADFRAPIFYDTDNTARFVDAAGTSVFNVVSAVGGINSNAAINLYDSPLVFACTGSLPYMELQQTGVSGGINWRIRSGIEGVANGGFSIRDTTAGANRWSIDSGGSVTAYVDSRAPIFYDSNNTAYFLDAASGSTSLFAAGLLRTYGWVQAGYLTGGVAMTTNDGYGNANIAWNHIGGTPEQNGNSARIVVNTDATSGVYMDFQVKSNVTSGVAVSLTSALTAYETYTEIKNSTRSPIYYDSEDTTYYINPNSTSNLVGLTVANTITGSVSGSAAYVSRTVAANAFAVLAEATIGTNDFFRIGVGGGSNAGYAEIATADDGTEPIYVRQYTGVFTTLARTATLLDGSGNTSFPGNISSGGNLYGGNLYLTEELNFTGAGTKVIDANGSLLIRYSDDSTFFTNRLLVDSTGFVQSYGDFRAPIFYDSDNTTYYIDQANSTTAIKVLGAISSGSGTTGGKLQLQNTGTNYVTATAGGVSSTIYVETGAFYVRDYSGTNTRLSINSSGNVTANVDIRAPIFYDSNDTNYYANPNGNSKFNNLFVGANESLIYEPATNAMGIRTGASGAYKYFTFTSGGRFVVNNEGIDCTGYFNIAYNNGNQFAGMAIRNNFASATNIGTNFIDFNNENGTQKTSIFGIIATDGAAYLQFLSTAPSVARTTDNRTTTAFAYYNQWSFQTAAGIASNVYYDRDNSAYYIDPNSTSNLVGLTVANTITGNISGSSNVANFLNGGASSVDKDDITTRTNSGFWQSSTGTTAEGWPLNNSAWQHMISSTHSNGANYYALQLAAGFDAQGLFYRSTNGSGTTAWSRVALYNNAYADNLRATTFYDNDNTAYYVDAASTSRLYSILVGGNESLIYENATNYMSVRVGASGSYKYFRFDTNGYLYTQNGGVIAEAGDIRAPLFYDFNDTTYFLDPANNVDVSAKFAGGIQVSAGNTSGRGIVLADDGDIVDMNDGYCSMRFSLGVRIRTGNRTGDPRFELNAVYGSANLEDSRGFVINGSYTNGQYSSRLRKWDDGGGIPLYIQQTTGTAGTWSNVASFGASNARYHFHIDGIGYSSSDWRAPIFYDSNDTNYYVNPNSYSQFYSIYANFWFRAQGDTGYYFESYGGGWHMTDTTWIRAYNSKNIYTGGEIAAAGNVTAYYSDERLKTKTGTISNAVDKVQSLEGFTYVENQLAKSLGYSNEAQQVGVSAQQVQAVLPEAVSLAPVDYETLEDGTIISKSGENYLTVDYSRLVPLLIEAIKEQQTQINTLESKIEEILAKLK